MAAHIFEEALSLEGHDGHYTLDVDETWEGQPGRLHGGFLSAVVVRAAGLTASAGRPVSLACQYLRPATVGERLDIESVSLRRGRTSELVVVSLSQAGELNVEALVRVADAESGPVCEPRERPDLLDPLSMPRLSDVLGARGLKPSNFFAHLDVHVTDPRLPPVGDHDSCGWVRMGPGIIYDDPFLEAARYVLAMDTQGAAILRRIGALEGTGQPDLQWGFANLDSLVHFHRWQGTDWLYIENRVITGSHGFVSAQTQAWSNGGDLLATVMSQVAFFPLRHGWSMLHGSE